MGENTYLPFGNILHIGSKTNGGAKKGSFYLKVAHEYLRVTEGPAFVQLGVKKKKRRPKKM